MFAPNINKGKQSKHQPLVLYQLVYHYFHSAFGTFYRRVLVSYINVGRYMAMKCWASLGCVLIPLILRKWNIRVCLQCLFEYNLLWLTHKSNSVLLVLDVCRWLAILFGVKMSNSSHRPSNLRNCTYLCEPKR